MTNLSDLLAALARAYPHPQPHYLCLPCEHQRARGAVLRLRVFVGRVCHDFDFEERDLAKPASLLLAEVQAVFAGRVPSERTLPS